MQPIARLTRAIVALAVIVAVVGGVPWLLVRLVGNPYPVGGVNVQLVTDADLIGLLAVLGWVFWAQMTLCLVAEMIGEIRRIRGRTPVWRDQTIRITATPATFQWAARLLVHAVLAVGVAGGAVGAGSVAALAAPAALSHVPLPSAQTRPHEAHHQQIADEPPLQPHPLRAVTVGGRYETLWSLAQRYLEDGQHWRQIAALNEGREMSDGAIFSSPNDIHDGWTLLMPASARDLPWADAPPAVQHEDVVTVQAGDTLSGIADETMGDAAHWPRLYRANQDTIADPNLIYPGQHLVIPSPSAPAPVPEVQKRDSNRRNQSTHEGSDSSGQDATTPCHHADVQQQQAQPKPHTTAPRTDHIHTADSTPGVIETPSPPMGHETDNTPTAQGARVEGSGTAGSTIQDTFAAGGVLAVGLFGLLMTHRRRRARDRRPRHTVAATPAQLVEAEKQVLVHGAVAGPDVAFIDDGLRNLAARLQAAGSELPDVAAVRATSSTLELVFRPNRVATQPPNPWTIDATGTRWVLRQQDLDVTDVNHSAPYPTLVAVGRDDTGGTWLLDLEVAAVVALTGAHEDCLELGRFIAAELAVNEWAADARVYLVGFGQELVNLNPARVTCAEGLDAIASQLTKDVGRVAESAQTSGIDVLSGRRDEIATDFWAPRILIVAPGAVADGGMDALAELVDAVSAQPSRSAVSVVYAGRTTDPDGRSLTIEMGELGAVDIAVLGVKLSAHRLTEEDAAAMASLMSHAASAEDEPVPLSTGSQAYQQFCDEAGGLRADLALPRDAESAECSTSLLPEDDGMYVANAATTVADLEILAPRVPGASREKVVTADPELDSDIADWCDPENVRPKLSVLGPIVLRVTAPRNQEIERRLAYYTELVAYLVTREHGATAEKTALAFDCLPGTIHSRISSLRNWLGDDPRTGTWYIPEATLSAGHNTTGIGVYEANGVLVDSDLFKRLRLRAQVRGEVGIEDLVTALSLVRGSPFDQQRRGGYGWLAERPLHEHLTIGIVDVAHIVATQSLSAGAIDRARWACEIAIHACPFSDRPRLDLAAVKEAEGDTAGAERYIVDQVCNREDDDEPPVDLSDRTQAILDQRGWVNTSRGGASS
jgi:nucleoid-associated protein YgaU